MTRVSRPLGQTDMKTVGLTWKCRASASISSPRPPPLPQAETSTMPADHVRKPARIKRTTVMTSGCPFQGVSRLSPGCQTYFQAFSGRPNHPTLRLDTSTARKA